MMTYGERSSNLTKQNPFHRALKMTWSLLARCVSFLVLVLVFYIIVTPIGFLMRLAGRDSMGIGDKTNEKTCRVRKSARDAKHLEKPY